MENRNINVYSEIGNLKTVLLHRPGEEIENLTPEYLERLLFDDIPFLKVARKEHDNFAKVLKDSGVNVIYLENLAAIAVKNEEIKDQFLDEVIAEGGITDHDTCGIVKEYLKAMPETGMIDKIMAGIRKNEVGFKEDFHDYPFLLDPMPNLYFTRDPFAAVGSGITLNSMRTSTRKRETIFSKYIFKYHPDFKENPVPMWYYRDEKHSLEGGDELILSKDVLAIGHSERSDIEAIKKVARNIFENGESFKVLLMFNIPKSRAFMHLDTVFTMIDYDKFTIHRGIEGALKVSAITYDEKNKELIVKEEEDCLSKVLGKYLKRDVTLIRCGGGDAIISAREQWNDGSNTLAISPGKVITYERNYVTNEVLDKYNVTVISIPSSELSRGRGGPRCMSMPLYRESVND